MPRALSPTGVDVVFQAAAQAVARLCKGVRFDRSGAIAAGQEDSQAV
jgi:hypothetical protein